MFAYQPTTNVDCFFFFFCLLMSSVYEMEKCLKICSYKHQYWWTTHYLNDNWIANWLIKTMYAIQAPVCLFVFKISVFFHNLHNYSEIYSVFYVRKNASSNISCNLLILLLKYERNYNNALFIYLLLLLLKKCFHIQILILTYLFVDFIFLYFP